jgi:hypothetical protein
MQLSSGGLDVTGALSASGNINLTNTGSQTEIHVTGGTSQSLSLRGGTAGARLQLGGSTSGIPSAAYVDADTHYFRNTSGTERARIDSIGLNVTGALSIGNTVNTVSPTSPNRTVTIVIGGTTYYLAAKTTND